MRIIETTDDLPKNEDWVLVKYENYNYYPPIGHKDHAGYAIAKYSSKVVEWYFKHPFVSDSAFYDYSLGDFKIVSWMELPA